MTETSAPAARPSNIDRITGKSFATTYACLLRPGQRYAATFDAHPRRVVTVSEIRESDNTVTIKWADSPEGKCSRVPAGKRYFQR